MGNEREAPELLPCPFCGGDAEIERHGDRRQSTIYACTMCGCRLETGEEWGHGGDWNRRASPLPPPGSEAEAEIVERMSAAFRKSAQGASGTRGHMLAVLAALRALAPSPAPTEPREGKEDGDA